MTNARRFFLKQIGLLGLASGIHSQVFAEDMRGSSKDSAFAFAVDPYLQNLQTNQVCIFALVNKKAFIWLELIDENGVATKHYELVEGLRQANKKMGSFRLQNLTANRKYRYRIHAKAIVSFEPYKVVYGEEIVSAEAQFSTLADNQDSVSCVILNDIHGNVDSYASLLGLVALQEQDFIVNNGDAVDYLGTAEDLEDKILAPMAQQLKGAVPFIMNRGNHETRGAYAFHYNAYFDYPKGHNYHSFVQGNTCWVFLDTGEDKPDGEAVYAGLADYDAYREEQAAWFVALAESPSYKNALFKVVVMHIPPFASGDWHGTMHVRKLFSPLFDKYAVDLVVSGHTHTHGHHPANGEHAYPILIGAGPKVGGRTLITLKGAGRTLSYALLKEGGELLFSKTLEK